MEKVAYISLLRHLAAGANALATILEGDAEWVPPASLPLQRLHALIIDIAVTGARRTRRPLAAGGLSNQ